MTSDLLTKISFLIGLIPAAVLMVVYGLRTRWNETAAGRAFFGMVAVTCLSYTLSLVTLYFPEYFRESKGAYVRIGIRCVIALVLWNLLILFIRAQRAGRAQSTELPPDVRGLPTMAMWPAPLRHLLLIVLATVLSWAGTELIPWLEDQPRWGLLASALLAALLAYVTPLVQSYGLGKSRPSYVHGGPDTR